MTKVSITNYSMLVIAVSVVAIGAIYVLTEPQPTAQIAKPLSAETAKQAESVRQPAASPAKPSQPATAPKTVQVEIPADAFMAPQGWKGEKLFDDKFYKPNKVEIRVGDTVEWTNKDLITHTVTFTKGATADSGPFEQSKTWKYTFTKAGEYEYFCTLHPYMAGRVGVEH
mgnify:FL=1